MPIYLEILDRYPSNDTNTKTILKNFFFHRFGVSYQHVQEKNKYFKLFSLVNSINRGQIEEVDMEGEEVIL